MEALTLFIILLVFGYIIKEIVKKGFLYEAFYKTITPRNKRKNYLGLIMYPMELLFASICALFLGVLFWMVSQKTGKNYQGGN